jgi:hypothetical protein
LGLKTSLTRTLDARPFLDVVNALGDHCRHLFSRSKVSMGIGYEIRNSYPLHVFQLPQPLNTLSSKRELSFFFTLGFTLHFRTGSDR